jgi:hypothetical protein
VQPVRTFGREIPRIRREIRAKPSIGPTAVPKHLVSKTEQPLAEMANPV